MDGVTTANPGQRHHRTHRPHQPRYTLGDALTDFKHEEQLSPQEIAERLVDIAYGLTVGGALELKASGASVSVPVAAEILLKRNSMSSGDLVEVHIELRWSA